MLASEVTVPPDPFESLFAHPYITEGGDWIHPNAPAGGGGQGSFTTPNIWLSPLIPLAHPNSPAGRQLTKEEIQLAKPTATPVVLNLSGVIVAGGALSDNTVLAVNAAAKKVTTNGDRYIAYETKVQVGGSLAWRANNPGNLRNAASKIGLTPGSVGHFAVFASLEAGRAAQKVLYLEKYGSMTVRAAIDKLTPPSENNTAGYLKDLKNAGLDLDKDVKSQIDALMKAVAVNEGLIPGTVVARVP